MRDLEALLKETDSDFTQRNIPPGEITPPKMNSSVVKEDKEEEKEDEKESEVECEIDSFITVTN